MPHRVRRCERVVPPRGYCGRRVVGGPPRWCRRPRPSHCAGWCPSPAAVRAGRPRAPPRPAAARAAAVCRVRAPSASSRPPRRRGWPPQAVGAMPVAGCKGGPHALGGQSSSLGPRGAPAFPPFSPHYGCRWGQCSWRVGCGRRMRWGGERGRVFPCRWLRDWGGRPGPAAVGAAAAWRVQSWEWGGGWVVAALGARWPPRATPLRSRAAAAPAWPTDSASAPDAAACGSHPPPHGR